MKKIIFIVLTTILIIYISYEKQNSIIKENKIYSQDIDFSSSSGYKVNVDSTMAIEKAKELISSIYNEKNFDDFEIDFDFYMDNTFYIYFNKDSTPLYFVNLDIDKGEVREFSRQQLYNYSLENTTFKEYDELKEISLKYMEKLQVRGIDNYIIDSYEYYTQEIQIKYLNTLTGESLSIILNIGSGELIEYSLY